MLESSPDEFLALADALLADGQSDEPLAQYRDALRIADAAYAVVPSDLLAL